MACRRGHTQIATILLDAKANPLASSKVRYLNTSYNRFVCACCHRRRLANNAHTPSGRHAAVWSSEKIPQIIHAKKANPSPQSFRWSTQRHLITSSMFGSLEHYCTITIPSYLCELHGNSNIKIFFGNATVPTLNSTKFLPWVTKPMGEFET